MPKGVPVGFEFPKKQCPKCKQMISIAQFSKHQGTKACKDVARQWAKQQKSESQP